MFLSVSGTLSIDAHEKTRNNYATKWRYQRQGEKKKRNHALEISCIASTNTTFLCRRIDADENKVGLLNGLVYARGEKEVATTSFPDDIDKPWFIYG